jgi:hypothetical protein
VGESEYWQLLQLRLNRKVAASPLELLLPGWCDWFTPKKYVLDGSSPRIMGRVGFVSRRNVSEWGFTLFLDQAVGTLTEIEWETLLPPEKNTGWLTFDSFQNRIEIRPSAGFAAGP